ncbi:hypothetical protein EZV62_011117 [Acer yangbiense]|uniref:UmuC domain-containing protein n=1 Tax=Acer yangbiense TaxID=1000413 RepID=A0A5C7I3L4_9ROSI|nr:hypothetical protein EZV62_011117 [Acer yangbiense]
MKVTEELRICVYEETGLTCSAGVAANCLLAKVCSDINKPNGQFVLPNDRMAVITFVSSLPIRKVYMLFVAENFGQSYWGIGKVTEHILRDVFGINTCEELLQKGSFLCALFSHSTAAQIAEMLSADMQKEGLHGRTLTLKLKTASFEVLS